VLYSVYLAREQAKTMLRLDEKLEQVKALSAENQQKDKYNQELLERQNTALEVLVKLRTEELMDKNAELEAQKIQISAQKEKLQDLDALKSRFFANISHEFRTPLTLILGPLKKRLEAAQSSDDKLEFNLMHRNATRLLNLVNQLLDLSQLEAGMLQLKASEGNLNDFLTHITSQFYSLAASKNLDFKLCAEEKITLYFDPEKLEKIILNLLGNAFKFTPAHGTVTISLEKREPVPEYPLGYAEITVQDSGIGIAPEHLPEIFDRFYQANSSLQREFGGSGIGLSLIKELVELHKGRVTVSSTPGVGSVFRVELPLGSKHLHPNQIVPANEPAPVAGLLQATEPGPDVTAITSIESQTQQHLVLIVEDNLDLRQFLEVNLLPHYKIQTAPDGEAGMAMALQQVPDLIISDLMMPKLDGLGLLQQLKKEETTSHIPFILLTARADAETRLQVFETGADAYITKPFAIHELQVRVQNLLNNRKLLQEKYTRRLTLQPDNIQVASADERFLKRVLGLVEAHLGDAAFGVAPMAKEMGMSEVQLYRKLQALTGLTPNEFIRQMRLKRAASLLGQKSGNVAEVAYEVGFGNLSYFAKCFRAAYGISPSKYKV
jgi:signal transduction histidine kinase/DNA-binding response OmpR family regulator